MLLTDTYENTVQRKVIISDQFGYSSKEQKFGIFVRGRRNVTQTCRLGMKLLSTRKMEKLTAAVRLAGRLD
jgi:hypothetical protein